MKLFWNKARNLLPPWLAALTCSLSSSSDSIATAMIPVACSVICFIPAKKRRLCLRSLYTWCSLSLQLLARFFHSLSVVAILAGVINTLVDPLTTTHLPCCNSSMHWSKSGLVDRASSFSFVTRCTPLSCGFAVQPTARRAWLAELLELVLLRVFCFPFRPKKKNTIHQRPYPQSKSILWHLINSSHGLFSACRNSGSERETRLRWLLPLVALTSAVPYDRVVCN